MANDRGMRLAGAETLSGLAAYRPLVEGGCYDVLMPDAKHAGGLEEIRRIAGLAQTAGMEIAPHNPTGPVCHAHSVHLCSVIPTSSCWRCSSGKPRRLRRRRGESLRFVAGAAPLRGCPASVYG
jgi:galactonate dehydratase